ncbi:hypothetical protein DITRI_Ditri16bG0119000 [Diplodiscus trichospermus]
MLPTNYRQNQTIRPPQTNLETPKFLAAIACFYLTFNTIFIVFQAYSHGDFCMAAFMVFVYFGCFILMFCITKFQALPPQENSPRKVFLKSVFWVFNTVFLFGFAYQFSTFINHPVAAIVVFAIAISASSLTFFLYFVHDGHHQQQQKQSCYRLKIKRLRVEKLWKLWQEQKMSNSRKNIPRAQSV